MLLVVLWGVGVVGIVCGAGNCAGKCQWGTGHGAENPWDGYMDPGAGSANGTLGTEQRIHGMDGSWGWKCQLGNGHGAGNPWDGWMEGWVDGWMNPA